MRKSTNHLFLLSNASLELQSFYYLQTCRHFDLSGNVWWNVKFTFFDETLCFWREPFKIERLVLHKKLRREETQFAVSNHTHTHLQTSSSVSIQWKPVKRNRMRIKLRWSLFNWLLDLSIKKCFEFNEHNRAAVYHLIKDFEIAWKATELLCLTQNHQLLLSRKVIEIGQGAP